jgi:hypothetical protein
MNLGILFLLGAMESHPIVPEGSFFRAEFLFSLPFKSH